MIFRPLDYILFGADSRLVPRPPRFAATKRENGSIIENGTIPLFGLEMPFPRPRRAREPMVPFALRPILVPRKTVSDQLTRQPYSPAIPGVQAVWLQTFSASGNSALPGGKFR